MTAFIISVCAILYAISFFMGNKVYKEKSIAEVINDPEKRRIALNQMGIFTLLTLTTTSIAGLFGQLGIVSLLCLTLAGFTVGFAGLTYVEDQLKAVGYVATFYVVCLIFVGTTFWDKISFTPDVPFSFSVVLVLAMLSTLLYRYTEPFYWWLCNRAVPVLNNNVFMFFVALAALILFGIGGYQCLNYLDGNAPIRNAGFGLYSLSIGFILTYFTMFISDKEVEKPSMIICAVCMLLSAVLGTLIMFAS